MKLLLTIALLLAGCEGRIRVESKDAPKPTQESMPARAADENAQLVNDLHAKANELHAQITNRIAERNNSSANPCATAERQRDQMLVNFEKLHEAFESLNRTNWQLVEALRQRGYGTACGQSERNDDTRLLADECLKVTYALKMAQDRIASLKDRVAELEKRLKVAESARHGWIDCETCCPPAAYGPTGAVFQEKKK